MLEVETIMEAETKAAAILEARLGPLDQLAMETFNLVSVALSALSNHQLNKVPESEKVQIVLLQRLSNDLRGVAHHARFGYPAQAATLAASIFEATWTSIHIGNDSSRASDWVDHSDERHTFGRHIVDLMRNAIRELHPDNYEDYVTREKKIYQELCQFKHINPIRQKLFGHDLDGNTVRLYNGPDTKELAINASFFALDQSIRYVLFALDCFAKRHLGVRHGVEISSDALELNDRRSQLWRQERKFLSL